MDNFEELTLCDGKGNMVAKKIQMIPQMAVRVKLQVDTFVTKWGDKPNGIILGPVEYLSLLFEVLHEQPEKELDKLQKSGGMPVVGSFMGLPVLVKSFPGIDLALPWELVGHFAIGRVEAQSDTKKN